MVVQKYRVTGDRDGQVQPIEQWLREVFESLRLSVLLFTVILAVSLWYCCWEQMR